MVQVEEHLASKCKALSSNPSTAKWEGGREGRRETAVLSSHYPGTKSGSLLQVLSLNSFII
jgi:hypothetical protein